MEQFDRKYIENQLNQWYYINETTFDEFSSFGTLFSDSLSEAGALLAGGSVLSFIHKEKANDLDVYINVSKADNFILFLLSRFANFVIESIHTAPAYDQSFFRKNNIINRIHFKKKLSKLTIDLMIIPDNITPKSVVTNFDLSFCEIWYDGIKVDAKNVKDSLEKKGVVNKEYLEALLKHFNKFIVKRILKYSARGYAIKYKCNGQYDIKNTKKTVTSPEEWVALKLYNNILFLIGEVPNYYTKAKFMLENPIYNRYNIKTIKDIIVPNAIKLLNLNVDVERFIVKYLSVHVVIESEPYAGYINKYLPFIKDYPLQWISLSIPLETKLKIIQNEKDILSEYSFKLSQKIDRKRIQKNIKNDSEFVITRNTIWERLCNVSDVSTSDLQKLEIIRNNMNLVLRQSTGKQTINSGNGKNVICKDIKDIVANYNKWMNELLPKCLNSETPISMESVADLGFGELLIIPVSNGQYNCISVEELVNMPIKRNPYTNLEIENDIISKAETISRLLKDYYEKIDNVVGKSSYEILEDLLRINVPYITNLRESIEDIDMNTIVENVMENNLLVDTIFRLRIDATTVHPDDFMTEVLIPIAQVEDGNTSTRRLAIASILYPDLDVLQ